MDSKTVEAIEHFRYLILFDFANRKRFSQDRTVSNWRAKTDRWHVLALCTAFRALRCYPNWKKP